MSLVDAVRAAREAGLRVRLADLGASQKTPILAEYDPARRTIAVDARIVSKLSNERGEAFARRFVAFAIRHELHHHRSGSRDERTAHRAAREACGDDAGTFEAAIRALAPR
jgi:hypothetical protein